jgi:cytochrome c biogenesis protein CcmG/thiol:disulfide interchange protein DsbE
MKLPMRPRLLASSLLLLFLALPAFARPTPPTGAMGGTAPTFSLPGQSGTVSLDSLRGRVVYVDFWASWCDPCRRSFPWLNALRGRYADRGLTIVAINLDKDRRAADVFLEKFPASFMIAYDPAGKTAEAYRVSAMPSSFLIGPTGELLASSAGFDPRKTGALEALIQEACPR